jgi:putative transport protein
MEWLHDLFKKSPEMALFLSLAVGYWIGKIKFGKFQLGGVAGSLLVAVVVSQVGVQIDGGVKAVLFALFIYAVGFESGPQFFSSLGKQSVKEIILAAVMAATGLATVVVMAKLCGLDKGLAAGVAAGGLTQSAIIGTAGDAIGKLGLAAAETARLQANVAIGYAVTYVFGSFGAIIVCVNILPKFMGRTIRDDAIAAETAQQAGVKVLGADQEAAAPSLVGRIYELTTDPQRTVADIENANPATTITIERVKRDGKFIEVSPALALRQGDTVLAVGRRDAVVASAPLLGKEVFAVDGMELTLEKREIVLTNKEFDGKTVDQIRQATAGGVRHGIFVTGLSRMGKALPMQPDTVVQAGDLVSIFGAEQDVKRVAALVGDVIVPSAKTDFVYMGVGLVVGLLDRTPDRDRVGGIPLTLGSGGGASARWACCSAGMRAKHPMYGAMPTAAVAVAQGPGPRGFRGGGRAELRPAGGGHRQAAAA